MVENPSAPPQDAPGIGQVPSYSDQPSDTSEPGENPDFDDSDFQLEDYLRLPEQIIVEWHAPNRPFKKRNRQYYTTIAIIVFLICLILFFAGQFLPIAVVVAVGFLAYVLSAIPPEVVTNKLTTYGIRSAENLYYWTELGRFWFTERYGYTLVHVEVARFPHHLTLLLGDHTEEEMTELLSEVLLKEKPLPTTFDKAATWLQEKIPLDTEA
jgi:hypothetical protein